MIIIGEKINGSIPIVAEAIAKRDSEFIKARAKLQAESGATYIDCCASVPEAEEVETLKWMIDCIQEVTDLPISIDSPSPDVLAQAFMQYKEGELSKEAYIEMKDDRNNWKAFCEERKRTLEHTIQKLEKQQKEEARFLRSLLELDGTTRINAELAESLIESMYLYGDGRLEINFGFKGAVEYE